MAIASASMAPSPYLMPLPVPVSAPVPEQPAPSPNTLATQVTSRTTALRLASGMYIKHAVSVMKKTQVYAKRANVPIDNLTSIEYKDPASGEVSRIFRQYCSEQWYALLYKKLMKDTLRKRPELLAILSQGTDKLDALEPLLADSAVVEAATENGAQGVEAKDPMAAIEFEAQVEPEAPDTGAALAPGSDEKDQSEKAGTKEEKSSGNEPAVDTMSPDSKEATLAKAEAWNEMAHHPAPPEVTSKGPCAVLEYYEGVLEAAQGIPVNGVLLTTVDARIQHAQKAVRHQQAREEREKAEASEKPPEEAVKEVTAFDPADILKGVEPIKQSSSILAPLHPHQEDGLSWLVYMYNNGMPAILGDQMGLGKTLQSISFLAYLRDELKVAGPHLIVAPLSVLSNWLSEIERFCPSLRAVRFHGPKEERTRIKNEELHDLAEFDVVVTTYEMMAAESNFFKRRFLWRVIVVDEGHRLKNDKSQLSQKLKLVPAYCRILLTGTPLQNNLRELWALLHFLMPDVFTPPTAEQFEQGFDLVKGICDSGRLREARDLLSILMLRRVKEQVAIPLPPKKEIRVLIKLTPKQHALYKHLLVSQDSSMLESIMKVPTIEGEDADGELSAEATKDMDYKKLMNLLLQLRKICNHPLLLGDFDTADVAADALVESSGKLQILDRMLPKLQEDNHRVLMFTQFTSMLDILEEYCRSRGHEYVRLDGSTNRVQRRLDIRRYNALGSKLFIFLISTRAGGLGINLASADTVILYDSDWNPQVDLQAMERAHRIGQTKPVRIYRLVMRGSVEERMVTRAQKKLYLNAMVAERETKSRKRSIASADDSGSDLPGEGEEGWEPALGTKSAMSKGELASLIRFGANAVFESDDKDFTDEDLDVLLGRREASATSAQAVTTLGMDASEMSTMKEVDLRALEGVTYDKKDQKPVDEARLIIESLGGEKGVTSTGPGKRKRKDRVVMVEAGTGLGEMPVLASTLDDDDTPAAAKAPKRLRRQWEHMDSCFCCKEEQHADSPGLMKCAHCPRAFHEACLVASQARFSYANNLVCPQVGCEASEGAAFHSH
ncbi:unnamed protein product [Chrysoparadoxa australica]